MPDNVRKSGRARRPTEKVADEPSRSWAKVANSHPSKMKRPPSPTRKSRKRKREIEPDEDLELDELDQELSDFNGDLLVDSLATKCHIKCPSRPETPAMSIRSGISRHSQLAGTEEVDISDDSAEVIELRSSRASSLGPGDNKNESDEDEVSRYLMSANLQC